MIETTLSPEVKERILKRMVWSKSNEVKDPPEPKQNYKAMLQKALAEWRIKR